MALKIPPLSFWKQQIDRNTGNLEKENMEAKFMIEGLKRLGTT